MSRHLVALALALVLPVLLLAGALAWSYVESERARLVQTATRVAAEASRVVDRELAGLIAATEVLAEWPSLQENQLDAFDRDARALAGRIGVNIVMRDRTSRQVVNTRLPRGAKLPVGDSRGSDERVLATGQPDVSDVIVGAVTGAPLFIVNVPVRQDRSIAYFLNLSLDPRRLQEILGEIPVLKNWTVTVVDRRGIVVADTRRHAQLVGKPLAAETWDRVRRFDGITRAELPTIPDEPALVAHVTSPLSGWTTLVGTPTSQADAVAHRPVLLLAALAAALTAAAIVLGLVFGRRISGAVAELAQAARRVGLGQPARPSWTAVRELNEVGRALVEAARRLGEREQALQQSERQLRLALEAGGFGSWEVDVPSGATRRAGVVVPARDGLPLQGYLLETYFANAVHPADVARLKSTFLDCATGRSPHYRVEYRVRGAEGGWRWVESYGAPVEHDPDTGLPLRVAGVSRDISERKAGEAAAAESEARLRAVIEQMPIGVAIAEIPSGALLYRNRRALEILGVDPRKEDAAGNAPPLAGALHADGSPYASDELPMRRAARGQHIDGELMTLRRPDGAIEYIEVNAAPVLASSGAAALAVATFNDVSARHIAERATAAAKERLEIALRGADLGTWHWDVRSGAVTFDARWARILDYPPEEIGADLASWRMLIHEDDRAQAMAALDAHLGGGSALFESEHRMRRRDGRWAWVLARGRVVERDVQGAPLILTGTTLDITARREAEEYQRLLMREVDHRAKNALTVVQAIVSLTPMDDSAAYARAVKGRIAALARAHTRLSQEGWRKAELRPLLEEELRPFGAPGDTTEPRRIVMLGPDVALPPELAAPVAMLVHELATNAVKYGALSTPEGRIRLEWSVQDADMLELRWTESGGPPVVASPKRRGFGLRLLGKTVRGQLGGSLDLDWRPQGLRCTCRLALCPLPSGGG